MAARVGIFDSGVGGLSVWQQIVRHGPGVQALYVADQAHIPYGSHQEEEVLSFSRGITRYLADQGCTVVVVACNTASAVALQTLRQEFPSLKFVGMEPAIKPAAQVSRRRVVGVLGTPATLAGELFRSTRELHARDVQVVPQPCPGLVERIEAGELEGEDLEADVRAFLRAPLAAGADVLVLACSHYPLVHAVIARLAGPEVEVIDPSPAIAAQLRRCLGPDGTGVSGATCSFRTTGALVEFEAVAAAILGSPVRATALGWHNGELATTRQAAEKA